MNIPKVVMALDVSLSATGMVVFDEGKVVHQQAIRVKALGAERLYLIREEVRKRVEEFHVDFIVLEGYSFGSPGVSLLNLGELGGVLRVLFFTMKKPFLTISPNSIKKFVLGSGVASKSQILKAVYKRFDFDTDDDNVADAYALGVLFMQYLNFEIYGVVSSLKYEQEVFLGLRKSKVFSDYMRKVNG